jgi:hypothetical protein
MISDRFAMVPKSTERTCYSAKDLRSFSTTNFWWRLSSASPITGRRPHETEACMVSVEYASFHSIIPWSNIWSCNLWRMHCWCAILISRAMKVFIILVRRYLRLERFWSCLINYISRRPRDVPTRIPLRDNRYLSLNQSHWRLYWVCGSIKRILDLFGIGRGFGV